MFRRLFIIALLSAVACLPSSATADTLRTVAEINDFLRPRANDIRSFRLKAVVQAIEDAHSRGARLFIIADSSGKRVQFFDATNELSVGDEILLTGLIHNRVREDPFWSMLKCVKTGRGTVEPPRPLAIREIDCDRHNLCELVTTGTVAEVRADEADPRYCLMVLRDGDATLQLSSWSVQMTNALQLVGSHVKVGGLFKRAISGVRKYNGPVLQVETLTVLRTPDTTPFDAPPLDTRTYQSPEELMQSGRRTVRGEVLACWGRHSILLNAPDGSIINVETSDNAPLPPVGAVITVSGHPDTDRYNLFLTRAVCRIDGLTTPTDERPLQLSIRQISSQTNDLLVVYADHHGKLLTLEGILRSVPSPDTPDRHAYVEHNGTPLKVDFSSVPNAFQGIAIGSTVAIVGRGIAQVENKTIFNRYPERSSFMLVLRSPHDVRVLKRPSWWTPARLLSVIGLLLVGIAGLLARIWFQRRTARLKLAERTRLAVELHDSLSQTLAGLACQIGATEDAIADKPEMVRPRLFTAKRMLQSCRSELRQCLSDLRSDILSETDFSRALARTIEPLKAFANVTVRFNVRRSLLDDSIAHATLAIVRELTANAIRHGAADSVRIAGTIDCEQLLFAVTDDGEGFDPEACAGIDEGHFGLNGIRERIKTLKGTFKIQSASGKGTRAAVTIPLNPK